MPPSTGYAVATATNPSSALTDFSLLIDLSRMPASWWAEVDTSDGTRGRAFKDDGTTELAVDWIDFDDTGETGWARVKWSGTLAASGTQKVRIYPPNTGNSAVSASDTYGSDNAYDSDTEAYYPDGGGTDHTSNGRDLTANGGVTFGGATGKAGAGTEYDGGNDYGDAGAGISGLTTAFAICGWMKHDTETADQALFGTGASQPVFAQLWRDEFASGDRYAVGVRGASSYDIHYGSTAPGTGWRHVGARWNGSTVRLYVDGVEEGSGLSAAGGGGSNDEFRIGAIVGSSDPDKLMDGVIDEVLVLSADRGDAWFAQEFDQGDDQASFWGTWSWESGGYTLVCAQGSFALSGQSAGLTADRTLAAAQGSFVLSGQAAGLAADRQLVAAQGSFSLSGQDVTLTYTPVSGDYSLTAEMGAFSLSGQAAGLAADRVLAPTQGSYALSGQDVGLTAGRELVVGQGAFVLSGQGVSLAAARALAAAQGAYVLSGQDVALAYSDGSVEPVVRVGVLRDPIVREGVLRDPIVREGVI